MADTLDYLESISAIDPDLAKRYRATVMSIGAAAVRDGYDNKHGGIYESGSPTAGPESKAKVWWIQAESMLSLWKLHQYYQGQTDNTRVPAAGPSYLQALARTARFVKEHLTDTAGGGEQYWQVSIHVVLRRKG